MFESPAAKRRDRPRALRVIYRRECALESIYIRRTRHTHIGREKEKKKKEEKDKTFFRFLSFLFYYFIGYRVYTLIGASSPLAVDFSALNEVGLFCFQFYFFLILICLRQVFIFLKPPQRTSSNIPVEKRKKKKNLSSPIDSSFYTIRPRIK